MQVYTALSVLCCRDGGRDMLALPRGGRMASPRGSTGIAKHIENKITD